MNRLLLVLAVTGCGTDAPAKYLGSDEFFAWDSRTVLCSAPIDDLTGVTRDWAADEKRFQEAKDHDWVTMVHAHIPGKTVSVDAVERVLGWADQYNLEYVTFDELDPGRQPHAGLAFAFDDDAVDAWYSLRPNFLAHHARLTFFVTRWAELTAQEKTELQQLVADGHKLEPHSVHHYNALDYARANGIDAYVTDEVLPSIAVMEAAGFPATSYAYPFGAHDEAIDEAVLQHIARVRTTPGECPDVNGTYPSTTTTSE